MQRRDFLAGLGATVAAGGLAGCIGTAAEHATRADADPDDANDSETDTDESAESGVEIEPPFETDADEPFERYLVGDVDERPDRAPDHVVFVRNAADDERSIALAVSADDGDLERSEALPPDEYLEIAVADPAPVSVVVESDGAMARTETGSADGGCSLTVVTISDGGVRTEARSTAAPCTALDR
ncbi:twin-arginine translocation signal domain-containing protein [Natronobeatus ordinarius]|uniref:twin-arginine translocation signal domain-containing protein n=1 Tax=Natronobeatus ordinarius TaxID=2963433 RepID=UPI0020CD1FEE|nr:twin-arginine translocation signal domain-containing protein [Natronobeatus ordinarius]